LTILIVRGNSAAIAIWLRGFPQSAVVHNPNESLGGKPKN
jgi:hypothetical protein